MHLCKLIHQRLSLGSLVSMDFKQQLFLFMASFDNIFNVLFINLFILHNSNVLF